MTFRPPPIYPITDAAISDLSSVEQVRQMAAGGARLIQLREKRASSREFYDTASKALLLAREHDVRLIINDRVDITMLLGTDGVHLGQGDLSPVHARRLLGERAIIGFSIHTLSQAVQALRLPIDYLAFGPVFATSSKNDPDPVVGLQLLAAVRKIAVDRPLVAIGGIDETNIKSVLDTGCDSAAMIGSILTDPEGIAPKVRSLLALTSAMMGNSV